MKRAVYPGSFDPMTFGHLDIVRRAASMFDELTVAVLNNTQKTPLFSVEERVNMLEGATEKISNCRVVSFSGLLVDFAKEMGTNVIVRGLRAVTDFEYELQIAQSNRIVAQDVDTIFLTTNIEYSYLSSSIVKEYAYYGMDISPFVPENVIPVLEAKIKNR